jgi:preprotein translocase subunit SecB
MEDNQVNTTVEQEEPGLTINAQYIKDLSFENPAPVENLLQQEEEAATSLHVEVSCEPLQESTFEVSLGIKGHVTRQDKTVYLIELVYAGIFTLSGLSEEMMKFALFVECPRLIFPFVRHLIAQVTQESGFPPLYIRPIDFAELLQQRLEKEEMGEVMADA